MIATPQQKELVRNSSGISVPRDIAIALLLACATLLIIDRGMSLAAVRYTASFFTWDARNGYKFRSNAHGWYSFQGEAYERINKEGFHDVDHALIKPPGTLRIAVVGSSYVAADQVPLADNFTSKLQRILRADGYPVETFNFGQDAYSPPQSFDIVQHHVWQYHPDIILFVVTHIDIVDTRREISVNRWASQRPYFDIGPNGDFTADKLSRDAASPSPVEVRSANLGNDLMNHFVLAIATFDAYQKLRGRLTAMLSGPPPRDIYRSVPGYPDSLVFSTPEPGSPIDQSWRIFEAILRDLKREAQRHNAEVWVVPISPPELESPDTEVTTSYLKAAHAESASYFDNEIAQLAQKNGIPAIVLSQSLAKYAKATHTYLHGFFNTPPGTGHWNETGHERAAEIIAADLVRSSSALNIKSPGQTR